MRSTDRVAFSCYLAVAVLALIPLRRGEPWVGQHNGRPRWPTR